MRSIVTILAHPETQQGQAEPKATGFPQPKIPRRLRLTGSVLCLVECVDDGGAGANAWRRVPPYSGKGTRTLIAYTPFENFLLFLNYTGFDSELSVFE